MTTPNDSIAAANERALEFVTAAQSRILDATKSYVNAFSGSTASWPLPTVPNAPSPKELIEETFRFQSQLLEANKNFALSITETWAQAAPNAATKK